MVESGALVACLGLGASSLDEVQTLIPWRDISPAALET